MNNIKISILSVGMAALALGSWAFAAERADIPLPSPRMDGGMPLLQALKQRQSARAFSPKALPEQVVADLLWAAFGINRPDTGKRTAPSARNWQEVDVFAITADGAYLYDANANVLKAVAAGDLRKLAGVQGFVGTAPLNLVFVADTARMTGSSPRTRRCMRVQMSVSSAKTFICSVRRKAWLRWYGAWSTAMPSPRR